MSQESPSAGALRMRRTRLLDKVGRDTDLACWCPLDQPCHADVLLELANNIGATVSAA